MARGTTAKGKAAAGKAAGGKSARGRSAGKPKDGKSKDGGTGAPDLPRAYWKGHLRLSLVSCAVALYPAITQSGHLTCHTINARTGNRIREEVLDAETGKPVPKEDRIKGCEVARNVLVPITDEELEDIQLESTHTINLEGFVERRKVDQRYFDRPYYIAPEDTVSTEAFAVIRDAMADRRMAGIGRVVLYHHERVMLLEPYGKGMLGTLLHYEREIRGADAAFAAIGDFAATEDQRDLAAHLIADRRMRFDPSKFQDRYEDALTDLVRSKKAGKPLGEKPRPRPTTGASSLLDILRRSVEQGAEADRPDAPPARRQAAPRRRTASPAAARRGPGRKAPGRSKAS